MDTEIRDQKCFTRMSLVLALQAEIQRLSGSETQRDYVRGMIRAAELLALPLKCDMSMLVRR